ncbi:MAG: putative glycosyl transferase [Nocardioidaceae bacterium]|nr:putative glycosyl transferase [Nocardioidaceae bacterium]
MSEILFVTWDGGGNVPPAKVLADELARRGHAVRFVGHEAQRAALAPHDLTPYAWRAGFRGKDGHGPATLLSLFSERGAGDDVLASLRERPADLVVVDCLLVAVQHACLAAGQPYVALEHLFDSYLRHDWTKAPGALARLRSRSPVKAWDGAAACLLGSLPSLDEGARTPAGNAHVVGPLLDRLPEPHDLSAHEPTVLVSLSTFGYAGMAQVLQRILDATAGLDARVVVTTAGMVPTSELRTAGNHEVHAFVPHDELMPTTSLLVGHGGHATTMRALAHDVPVLVLPMHPLLDQPLVGRAVASAGAGATTSRKTRPPALRSLVTTYLADGPHRTAAARLGREIRALDGRTGAADVVGTSIEKVDLKGT